MFYNVFAVFIRYILCKIKFQLGGDFLTTDQEKREKIEGIEEIKERNKGIVFKSYLKRLLRNLTDVKKAIKNDDMDKANELVDQILDETQNGVVH